VPALAIVTIAIACRRAIDEDRNSIARLLKDLHDARIGESVGNMR